MGHDVTVLAGEPDAEKPYEEVINDVRVVRWPVWCPSGAYHIPKMRKKLERTLFDYVRGVDVVHIHSAHSVFSVEVGLAIRRYMPGIRLISTLHYHGGGHSPISDLLWLLWKRRVAKLVEVTDTVHSVSKAEARRVLRHYPQASEKLVIIPNGVDEDVLKYEWVGKDSNYMVYAGRIEKYKNLDKAVEVANYLGLKLLVIGDGPYRRRLEIEAGKIYPGGVAFKKFLPRAQYLELLSKARYAINLSRREAFSIFIAEALAIGVPAIVSKEIAENLEVGNDKELEELVIVERSLIKTWDDILKQYLKMYER
jgi:glycosyltransferase involved in cell wall biosynthesis